MRRSVLILTINGTLAVLAPSLLPSMNWSADLVTSFNWVRVIDHKPNLNDPKRYSSQMFLYREGLHRRTSVPRERISIAAFNEPEMVWSNDLRKHSDHRYGPPSPQNL